MSLQDEIEDRARKVLLDSIDVALAQFGPDVAALVYFKTLKKFNLGKAQIVIKPEVFEEALELVFGKGARAVEEILTNHLRAVFNPPYAKSLTLAATIRESYKVALSEEQGKSLLIRRAPT